MKNAGIDYGMGLTNFDPITGIRYGVISQHTVGDSWFDASEPQYGDPCCPKCGEPVHTLDETDMTGYRGVEVNMAASGDFVCLHCDKVLDPDNVTPDEPIACTYEGQGYQLEDCMETNIMVFKSRWYTYTKFCSPCLPGAGDLDSPIEGGVKTYCLDPGWFKPGKCPYPVWSVENDIKVDEGMEA